MHPSYVRNASQQHEGVRFSIFELKKEIRKVPPSPLYRKPPTVGTLVTLVGFGLLGTGAGGAGNGVPPKGKSPLARRRSTSSPTFIKWNFDNVPPPNRESNTAPGDSGGPEFITEAGIAYLAAITSGGVKNNASFGDLSYNTRVDAAIDWIESITGGAAVADNHAL